MKLLVSLFSATLLQLAFFSGLINHTEGQTSMVFEDKLDMGWYMGTDIEGLSLLQLATRDRQNSTKDEDFTQAGFMEPSTSNSSWSPLITTRQEQQQREFRLIRLLISTIAISLFFLYIGTRCFAVEVPAMMATQTASRKAIGDASSAALGMEWKDLCFSVDGKVILKNLSGFIKPGRLTCILGPSGSGKTSLLNLITGRQDYSRRGVSFSGCISVNGVPVRPEEFRDNIAYVMQDDALLATETPREVIRFSSCLRQQNTSADNSEIEDVIQLLRITECADTPIGDGVVKGISGGERKRASIGMELVTKPKVIVLDEPLSGLDSYAAYALTKLLRDLAEKGVSILMSLHQPSSEIFELFDDAIILHAGEVAFCGPVQTLPGFCKEVGHPAPNNCNAADHFIFLLQRLSSGQTLGLKMESIQRLRMSVVNELEKATTDSPDFKARQKMVTTMSHGNARKQFWTQFCMLLLRDVRGHLRNKELVVAEFGSVMILGSFFAWIFAKAGSVSDNPKVEGFNCHPSRYGDHGIMCSTMFQAHFGAVMCVGMAAMLVSSNLILVTFPLERGVFLREHASNMYGVVAYMAAKIAHLMVVVFFLMTSVLLLINFVVQLQGNFFHYVVCTWMIGVSLSSVAVLLSCFASTPSTALMWYGTTVLLQLMFSGCVISMKRIPLSIRWLQHICPLKYSINLLCLLEFHFIKVDAQACNLLEGASKSLCKWGRPGDFQRLQLLELQHIRFDDLPFYVAYIVLLGLAFYLLAGAILWRMGKYVY